MTGRVYFEIIFMLDLVSGRIKILKLTLSKYLYEDFLLNCGDET